MGILTDFVELARAGFTKAEILQIVNRAAQAPSAVHAVAPASAKADTPAPATTPAPDPAPKNDLLEEVRNLLGEIRTANVLNSQQPKEITVDDVIAQIVNPNDGGENNGH